MKISKQGIEVIKKWEGCKLKAYKCSADVWTIGYGYTQNVDSRMTITESGAIELLKHDLTSFEKQVNNLLIRFNQNQFDAVCSLVFNIGIGRFLKSRLWEKMQKNSDDLSISFEWVEWIRVKGKRKRGLLLRRLDELQIYYKK